MDQPIEKYSLGTIEVKIYELPESHKLKVYCNDGTYRSEFILSKYEFDHYKRHMNQRIKNAYKQAYREQDD